MNQKTYEIQYLGKLYRMNNNNSNNLIKTTFLPSFLPLGATAQGELWPPEQYSLHSSMRWLMAVSVRDTFLTRSFSYHAALPC
jgi:hypothetical protein